MISNKKSLLFTLILGLGMIFHQKTQSFPWQITAGIITAALTGKKAFVVINKTPHIPRVLRTAYMGTGVYAYLAKNNLRYYTETLFTALGLGYATYKLYQSYKKKKKTSNRPKFIKQAISP